MSNTTQAEPLGSAPHLPELSDLIPDLAQVSDDILDVTFPCWDGAWSRHTKELMTRFGAKALDLNDNWASTPRFWLCPSCQRSKPQLVRLSSSGVLLCHLEWHHDHLYDRGKAILRKRNPPEEGPKGIGTLRAIDACKGLIERFHTVLICQDCNAAEGDAKKQLKATIDRDFSFSPSEIASFITVTPNKPHAINVEKASAAWQLARGEFDDLVRFAELLAERVAQGHHRKSGMPPHHGMGPTTSDILRSAVRSASGVQKVDRLVNDLAMRSVRRQGVGTAAAKRQKVTSPSDEDFAAFDARQDNATQWRRAPSDWRCAACERDRRQILRRSNKGVWTAQIHRFCEYLPEDDATAIWERDADPVEDLVFGDHAVMLICGDCRHIITDVKTRAPALDEDHFSLADLQQLVAGAAPNVRHAYDIDAAIARAVAGTGRHEAVRDYFKHRTRALDIRSQVERTQQWNGCSVDDALHSLAWDVGYSDEDNQAWENRLRWLLAQSDRYIGQDNHASF